MNVEIVKNKFIYKFTGTSSNGEAKVPVASPHPGEGGYPHLQGLQALTPKNEGQGLR